MIEWPRVQAILGVLDSIRPILRADGGDVELLEVQAKGARILRAGLGAGCPGARLTMQTGLEEVLRMAIRDFGEPQLVFE